LQPLEWTKKHAGENKKTFKNKELIEIKTGRAEKGRQETGGRRRETGDGKKQTANNGKTIFTAKDAKEREKRRKAKRFLPTKKGSNHANKGKGKKRKGNFYREGHEEREE